MGGVAQWVKVLQLESEGPRLKPAMYSARLRDATFLWGSWWPWVEIVENAVVNIGSVSLPPRQWPNIGGGTAK